MSEFQEGDRVVIFDKKGRKYLTHLQSDGEFHTHSGVLFHKEIIGKPDGSNVEGTGGTEYTVIKPTISDIIYQMPRGAQVIYPKDLAQILFMADIFPGAHVLEAGVGSGALSMTLIRAGAQVTGYELREDFANRARKNVTEALGDVSDQYEVQIRDIYEGIDETGLDRVILDLPEPWQVVKHAENALNGGGIFVAYVPSITQVAQLRDTLTNSSFGLMETVEVLIRSWHIEGQSVRPDHRMVAHTGFLTSARLLGTKT